ncbi:magnesium transporter MgtE N-terminal domain-containing protein [candidate division KSB1 bacterium]
MRTNLSLTMEFLQTHPENVAIILEKFPPEETVELLKQFPPNTVIAPVLQWMDISTGAECLRLLSDEYITEIFVAIPLHLCARLLRQLEKTERDRLLTLASEKTKESLILLLKYPEDTAGGIMDPQIFSLPEDISVDEAKKRVQNNLQRLIYYIYVINRSHQLVGVLNLKELFSSPPKEYLVTVMKKPVDRISVNTPSNATLSHPGWLYFPTLPVVDGKDILLGVIHYKTKCQLETNISSKLSGAMTTAAALGELYWLGGSSLFSGLINAFFNLSTKLDNREK